MMGIRLWRYMLVFVLLSSVMAFAVHPSLPAAAQDADRLSIIFMHHSTGLGLLQEGEVREAFTRRGYDFWDHGYNEEGLVDPAGNYLGINWDVPGDNTDPDGWYQIFNQPYTDPPTNAFSHMLQHDVIIFKSCFPNADITSEDQLEEYQRYFLSIRDVMDRHPDKLFIAFTLPPLVPNETSPENAARARRWAEYLTSDDFLAGHPNVFVFDFFSYLADEDGFLRAEYRGDEWDSHPNTLANQTVGPLFVEFVVQAIDSYIPAAPLAEPIAADDTGQEPGAAGEEVTVGAALTFAQIGDFEGGSLPEGWWDYVEGGTLSCGVAAPGYDSAYALQMAFDMEVDDFASCGVDLAPNPDWADADGIGFDWQGDRPDLYLFVAVGVQDPAAPDEEAVPFEVELLTSGEEWERVEILWDDFEKVDWWGDSGVDELDPANVVWLSFGVGHWEQTQRGMIAVDNIRLLQAE